MSLISVFPEGGPYALPQKLGASAGQGLLLDANLNCVWADPVAPGQITVDTNELQVSQVGDATNIAFAANVEMIGKSFNCRGSSAVSAATNTVIGATCPAILAGAANNVIIGELAGNAIDNQVGNTILGANSGQLITTGGSSEIIGYHAASNATDAVYSVVVGSYAGPNCGNFQSTVALGYESCTNVDEIATNCTYVGVQSGQSIMSANATNQVAIGYQAKCTADNQVSIGNNSTTQHVLNGSGQDIILDTSTTYAHGQSFAALASPTAAWTPCFVNDPGTIYNCTSAKLGDGAVQTDYNIMVFRSGALCHMFLLSGADPLATAAAATGDGYFTFPLLADHYRPTTARFLGISSFSDAATNVPYHVTATLEPEPTPGSSQVYVKYTSNFPNSTNFWPGASDSGSSFTIKNYLGCYSLD